MPGKDIVLCKTWFFLICIGIVFYQLFIKPHNFVWADHINDPSIHYTKTDPKLLARAIFLDKDIHPRFITDGNGCTIKLYKYEKPFNKNPQKYLKEKNQEDERTKYMNANQFIYVDDKHIFARLLMKDFNQYKDYIINLIQFDTSKLNIKEKNLSNYERLTDCQSSYLSGSLQGIYQGSKKHFFEKYAIFTWHNLRDDLEDMLTNDNTIVEISLNLEKIHTGSIRAGISYKDVDDDTEIIIYGLGLANILSNQLQTNTVSSHIYYPPKSN